MMTFHSNDRNFMKEVENMFAEDKTDWKSLSENLNKALVKEIEENKQLRTIISYLENKLGYDSVWRG